VSEIVPTAEEDAAAEKQLREKSAKELHSLSTTMNTYKKSHDDPVLNAKGNQAFQKNFLILQMRTKNASKFLNSERDITQSKGKHTRLFYWNKHKMVKEMGLPKATGWMGILKAHPDRLTGSLDVECVEYHVPVDWESMDKADLTKLALNAEVKAIGADEAKFMEEVSKDIGLSNPSSGSAAGTAEVGSHEFSVKLEEKSDDEKKAEQKQLKLQQAREVGNSPEKWIRKYQTIETDAIKIRIKAGEAIRENKDNKYATAAFGDAEALEKRLATLLRTLKKMLQQGMTDDGAMKAFDAMVVVDSAWEDLQEWSTRLGFGDVATKKRRTNKSSA
jgi:hypothetical protein